MVHPYSGRFDAALLTKKPELYTKLRYLASCNRVVVLQDYNLLWYILLCFYPFQSIGSTNHYYQAILRSLAATHRVSVDFLSQTYYDVSVQSVVIHICAIWFPLRSDMFSPFSVSTSLLIRLLVIPNNPFSHLTIDSTLISILISSMLQIFVSYIITNRPLRVAKTKRYDLLLVSYRIDLATKRDKGHTY